MFYYYRSTECVPEHFFKNFQLVLSLVMYIQGLSVIHFFGKAKGLPNAVTILLLVIGTILTPTTHICRTTWCYRFKFEFEANHEK